MRTFNVEKDVVTAKRLNLQHNRIRLSNNDGFYMHFENRQDIMKFHSFLVKKNIKRVAWVDVFSFFKETVA